MLTFYDFTPSTLQPSTHLYPSPTEQLTNAFVHRTPYFLRYSSSAFAADADGLSSSIVVTKSKTERTHHTTIISASLLSPAPSSFLDVSYLSSAFSQVVDVLSLMIYGLFRGTGGWVTGVGTGYM